MTWTPRAHAIRNGLPAGTGRLGGRAACTARPAYVTWDDKVPALSVLTHRRGNLSLRQLPGPGGASSPVPPHGRRRRRPVGAPRSSRRAACYRRRRRDRGECAGEPSERAPGTGPEGATGPGRGRGGSPAALAVRRSRRTAPPRISSAAATSRAPAAGRPQTIRITGTSTAPNNHQPATSRRANAGGRGPGPEGALDGSGAGSGAGPGHGRERSGSRAGGAGLA
jgi:hypothetical protein